MELHEILKDFDDLTEPACMDRILMYVEELKEEDELFMELLIDKVRNEDITWNQPWYQQTNSISRPLHQSDENQIQFKTDTISTEEHDIIVKNWNKFIKKYELPDKIICLARWKNKEKSRIPKTPEECARRFVLSYLSRGLERTIFQVFRHIQAHFGGSVRGAYSPVEEQLIEVCFTQHPNNCVSILSKVLGREPRGIYKRLRHIYNGKPERKRIKWNLPLATKLVSLLMQFTGLPLEELKNRKFDKEVWLKIEEEFEHPYISLQNFWYHSLHVQLFVKKSVKMIYLQKKILKKLQLYQYRVWTDIRWKEILQLFPEGYTHFFLYKLCYRLVSKMPKYQKEPLPKLINFGLESIKSHRTRRLRTLSLKDGNLEVVIYNKSDSIEVCES